MAPASSSKTQLPDNYELLLEVVHDDDPDGIKVTHIEVDVKYAKGGHSAWDQQNWPRGIFCSIGPVGIQKHEHGETRAYGILSAPTFLLEPQKVLNRKRVAHWFEVVKKELEGKTGKPWSTLTEVLKKNNLVLKV